MIEINETINQKIPKIAASAQAKTPVQISHGVNPQPFFFEDSQKPRYERIREKIPNKTIASFCQISIGS